MKARHSIFPRGGGGLGTGRRGRKRDGMGNGEQDKVEGAPENTSNMSTGSIDASVDSPKKDKSVALSELIDGMIESLKQLKNSSFSKEDLKRTGIASSFQDLPCTFDICLTKENGKNEETTRIRRELKHILKKKFSSRVRGGKACSGEKYQTYVDLGIEHCVKPSKQISPSWKVVCWVLVVVVVLLVALVNNFPSSKQNMEISHSVFRLQNGTTNLTQKAVLNIQGEVKRK